MRLLLGIVLLCFSSFVSAKILSIEFHFAPFVGDVKADHVETVPGKATVYVNNVPVAEQKIEKKTVPVLFDDREIGPVVWVPASSMGKSLRKGKNQIRIEFMPANSTLHYDVQLRWASVTDHVTRTESGPGQVSSTNQSDEGGEIKPMVGKAVVERDFIADFPDDLPWHHYPPITALTDADKAALTALLAARAATFKPDFSAAYQVLQASASADQINLAGIQKSRVLFQAYQAGIRIVAPAADQIDFVLTGNPEVVLRSKKGNLFPLDRKAIGRIHGEELQFGLAIVFGTLYPPQLVVVKDDAGKWEIVY